jgi:hypothetical protein
LWNFNTISKIKNKGRVSKSELRWFRFSVQFWWNQLEQNYPYIGGLLSKYKI